VSDFQAFYAEILTLLGEVPTETLVAKIRAEIGEDAALAQAEGAGTSDVKSWVSRTRPGTHYQAA
jgi:hypothetical protein